MESNVIIPKSSTAVAMLGKVAGSQSKGDEVAMVPFDQLLQQATKTAGKGTDRTGDEGELGGVVDRVNARKGDDGPAPHDDQDDGADDWSRDRPEERTEDWRDDWSTRPRETSAAPADDRPPPAGGDLAAEPEVAPAPPGAAEQSSTGTEADGKAGAETAATVTPTTSADGAEAARDPAVAGAVAATKAAAPAQRRAAPNSAVAQGTAPTAAAKANSAGNQAAARSQSPETGTPADAAVTAAPAKKAATATAQTARAPSVAQQAPAAAQAGQQRQQGDNAAAKQGADLSSRLGGKTSAQVSVTVEDDAASVASQPRGTIAAPTVAGANGKPANGAAQGRNSRSAAAGQTGAANQPAAAQAAAQAQAQPQVQASTPTAAAGAAKAAGPTAVQSVSAGSAASGGGEALGTGTTGEARQAQHTAAAQNQKAATMQRPPVAEQVSIHIAKAVRAGIDRIHIQLKPESMGRVDVQMEIAKDGRVTAVVTVDNRETLNTLQKDSHTLEQALRDAGLQADSDDLQFNLRGERGGEDGDGAKGGRLAAGEGGAETGAEPEPDGDAIDRTALLLARARGLANRIDIRA